jgi:sporulation protein YlmC with PRC-barrel domain
MLRSARELFGYTISARDGTIGTLRDVLFDDATWDLRYLVADIGSWLLDTHVLLPPEIFEQPRREERTVPVRTTRERIQRAPWVEDHPPVSRRAGEWLLVHGGYWPHLLEAGIGAGLTGRRLTAHLTAKAAAETRPDADPHLRSAREVVGYHIHATDGPIGHVEDFILETDARIIRHVVVDTANWWPGKQVLVAPDRTTDIDWPGRTVHIELGREEIKHAPSYDPSRPVNLEDQERVCDYHGRLKYWMPR